ncbi:MAG: acylphosphatase [Syntrophales bacterium]|jgi:acylphosphatase|nr:acylphosphatase [Syntrophales bacterium]MCK9527578.1 acylphosphatase [Syntrophales bacterium]MDX9922195.1 acylphosphatase [Syntrophales bacterium]
MNDGSEPQRRVRILVSGRVQGVFFRAHTLEEARRRSIGGWVRNLPDGRVEVLAEGENRAVNEFVAWCRRGPRFARVLQVDVMEERPGEALPAFHIR